MSAADLAATVRNFVVTDGFVTEAEEALAALDALLARCQEAEREARVQKAIADHALERANNWTEHAEAVEARVAELEQALREIEAIQPTVIESFRANGIVFDRAPATPADPSDWQQIAFAIYTYVCQADSIARAALQSGGREG